MKHNIDTQRIIIDDLISISKKPEDNFQILKLRAELLKEINLSVIKSISHEIYKKTLEEKVILANAKILHKKQNPNFKFGGKY